MTPGVKYLVEFPGQYGNADQEVECLCDAHGVWRKAAGGYIPEPKEVARGFYIRLICAPQSIIEAMKK